MAMKSSALFLLLVLTPMAAAVSSSSRENEYMYDLSSSAASSPTTNRILLSEEIIRDREKQRKQRRRRIEQDESDDGDGDDDDEQKHKVIIGYLNNDGLAFVQSVITNYKQGIGLLPLQAVSGTATLQQITALENHSGIEYVERDPVVRPLGEVVPFGIDLIHARSDILPAPMPEGASSPCNDPNSFKVGIIDSGTDITNPDIPCLPINDPNTNCIGKSYTASNDEYWWNPSDGHGTHVHGTIGALGNNDIGVRGVLDDYATCYVIARVFGRSGAFDDVSTLLDAVEWVVDRGAKVINMSLGGDGYSIAAEKAYKRWLNQDVLFVVAAGNDGGAGVSTTMYPASYNGVLSIAAVDEQGNKAGFSSFNSQVDLAAPGQGVLSTIPLAEGGVATIVNLDDPNDAGVTGSIMAESPSPPESGVSGELVDCPDLGKEKCPGGGGHICLIERYARTHARTWLRGENGKPCSLLVDIFFGFTQIIFVT